MMPVIHSFFQADTLVSIDNKDLKKRRLLAYHNVKIFKTDMQGKADRLFMLTQTPFGFLS